MSNFVYNKAKQGILNGKFNFAQKSFKVLFTNSTYVPNQNLNEFVSDINPSSIVFRSNNLLSVLNTNGTIDADDLDFTLGANISFKSIILFQSEVLDQESRLLAYIDDAVGLPYSGVSIAVSSTIVWNNLSGKILSI